MIRYLTGLLAVLFLGGCVDSSQPDAAEQRLLLSAADFGYDEGVGSHVRTRHYWTRTTDITYDYEQAPGLFLHNTLSFTPSAAEALIASYSGLQAAGIALGLMSDDITEEDIALPEQSGSHARLVLLRHAGEPIGNMFSFSLGKKVFFGVFTGDHYFDSGAEFADFIAPWLAAIEAHPHQDPLLEWGKALFSDADDEPRDAQQASQAKNQ